MSPQRPASTLERKAKPTGLDSIRAEKRAPTAHSAISSQAQARPEPVPAALPAAAPTRPAFFNHHLNYHQTLGSMQRKLPTLSRYLSQIIHSPALEKTGEILETTIARPSVLLGSTWTALVVGTIFYVTARRYGYALSGSELLFSLIVGGLLGLAGERLWRLITRR